MKTSCCASLGNSGSIEVASARLVIGPPSDRKSTRLNSSHSQISYAVFCLKKKKLDKIAFLQTASVGCETLSDLTCTRRTLNAPAAPQTPSPSLPDTHDGHCPIHSLPCCIY